jgi:polysaccharide pyruvyl transferase WcaK-like protein
MTKKVNVCHLASFSGNIGDNANHLGSRAQFKKFLNLDFEISEIEIRSFYRKERFFDDAFIREVNKYDLLIIGGGNYFELWPANSRSGTSIDLGVEQLSQIRVPTLFYSLGVDLGQGVSLENKMKFDHFLEYLISQERFFVSVRNDGAKKNLSHLFGEKYSESIAVVPDGGFFVDDQIEIQPIFRRLGRSLVGINLAGDMMDIRLKSQSTNEYLCEFSKFIDTALSDSPEVDFVFFTHIPKDMLLLAQILNRISDKFARGRVYFAPYGQGLDMAKIIFGIYKSCDLIIGNRFHSNVVPIGFNVPTIGISNFPQIDLLYDELNLSDRIIDINQMSFAEILNAKVQETLANKTSIVNNYMGINRILFNQINDSFEKLKIWMTHNKIL